MENLEANMIITTKIRKGITIKKVFLADSPLEEGDIVRYYDAQKPIGKVIRHGKTILNDLTESEEELFNHFSKSCKYKINRATREGVTFQIFLAKDITDQMIEGFVDYFIDFHNSKGLPNEDRESSISDFKELRKQGVIEMAIAMLNDKTIVYHTHLVDYDRAFLRESASHYRLEEDIPKNVVGMANRYLHYEEMKYFKRLGKDIYDWGGAGEGETVKSILCTN